MTLQSIYVPRGICTQGYACECILKLHS